MEEQVIKIGDALLAFTRTDALALHACIEASDNGVTKEEKAKTFSAKVNEMCDTLLELPLSSTVQLKEYLESKGIMIIQNVVIAQEAVAEVEEVKESENVNLVLVKSGGLIKLAKALAPITGKGAMEIKKLNDSIPSVVMAGIPRETGKALINQLANELDADTYGFVLEDV